MNANMMKKVIEMNKAEAKAAGRVGTSEFEELAELRDAYPGFRVVIKTTKSKDNMKGLTVSYMEKYIKAHDDDDGTILKEFYTLRGLDAAGNAIEFAPAATYGELKMWFLDTYPEVADLNKGVDEILKKVRKNREAKRQATDLVA